MAIQKKGRRSRMLSSVVNGKRETNYTNKLLKRNIVFLNFFCRLNHKSDGDFKQIMDYKTESSKMIE